MFKNVKISNYGRTVEFAQGRKRIPWVCECPFGHFYIPACYIMRENAYGRADVLDIAISLDRFLDGEVGGRVYLSDYTYCASRHKLICDDLPDDISVIPVVIKNRS